MSRRCWWSTCPGGDLFGYIFLPDISLKQDYIIAVVAVFGTTISPYLFFWQASEEAEEEQVDPGAKPLIAAPEQAPREIHRIRLDTYLGMGYSNLIGLFIIITAAATLHAHGVTDIQHLGAGGRGAAPDRRPVRLRGLRRRHHRHRTAGGAGARGQRRLCAGRGLGLERRARRGCRGQAEPSTPPSRSRRWSAIGINFVPIDPIKALFWTAVINGVVAVPLMIVMMIMTANSKVMGAFTLSRPLWLWAGSRRS